MSLDQQIQAAQKRLQQIQHQAEERTEDSPLLTTAIAELAVALEELHAATEELHLQNEELLATHHTLEQERQRYQNLFDFAPDAYLVTNDRGVIEAVNGAAEELLNIRRDAAKDKPLIVFIAEADHNFIYEQLDRVARWGQHQAAPALAQGLQRQNLPRSANILLQDHEISIQPRDGVAFAVSLALSAEFDYQRKPVGLHWLLRDLRDRQRAEQEIRTQATLLDIAPNAIFTYDLNDQILYWNQGARQLYGWSATEAIGQSVDDLVYQDAVQLAKIKAIFLKQETWQGEVQRNLPTGRKVSLEVRCILVRNNLDNRHSILVVETDITARKQLEAQFYHAQRLESLGILTGGIAHNLNNIFTPIYGVAQLLTQPHSKLDAESREMMKLLTKSTERGMSMVKQILAFTRGADQQASLVDIAALVKEVVNVAQQIFPKSISVQQHIPAQASWLVLADVNYLNQVLMNLCVNARDAMPDGGVLSLSIEAFFVDESFASANLEAEVGDYVVMTISDTGTGISPDIIDHIFDPFFTTKEPDQGTGLGLATVLGIVKNYGGFLRVFSEVGQGTQFKIYLPQAQGEEISFDRLEEPIYGNWDAILLVDDEVSVQLSTQALLERYNYVVLSTDSALDALETYAQHQDDISAVILDLAMPTLDGFGLIQRLREINPAVKIMAISGLPSNQEKALAAGAMVFLAKPYSLNELLRGLYGLIYGHSLEG